MAMTPEKRSQYASQYAAVKARLLICMRCTRKAEPNRRMCRFHLDQDADRNRDRMKRRYYLKKLGVMS